MKDDHGRTDADSDSLSRIHRRTVLRLGSTLTLGAVAATPTSAAKTDTPTTDRQTVDDSTHSCTRGSRLKPTDDGPIFADVDYREYERETPYSDLTLSVHPDADPDDDPEALLEFLAWQATDLELAAFDTVPGTLEPRVELGDRCGVASRESYRMADGRCATLDHNTIGHEYVHIQQVHSRTIETRWLIEAVADFYQRLFAYRRGYTSFLPIARAAERAREHYSDTVLADPTSWGAHPTYPSADYLKGSTVILELDRRIRKGTDGSATFDDVFAEMNARDITDHESFLDAVEAATGYRFESFFDRYVFGSDQPDLPDSPEPFDRHYEFEFDDEMVYVPSQKTYDNYITIGQLGGTRDLIAGYRIWDDVLGTTDPVSAGEISYRNRIELDRPTSVGEPPHFISLYTVDENGNPDERFATPILFIGDTGEVSVIDEPQPAFDVVSGEPRVGEPVRFDASDTEPQFLIDEYEWDLTPDDRTDAAGSEVTHTYTDPGEYEVRLIVTDVEGVTETTTTAVTVTESTDQSPVDYVGDDGVVRITGVLEAVGDYGDGEIDIAVLLEVISAYSSGETIA